MRHIAQATSPGILRCVFFPSSLGESPWALTAETPGLQYNATYIVLQPCWPTIIFIWKKRKTSEEEDDHAMVGPLVVGFIPGTQCLGVSTVVHPLPSWDLYANSEPA